MKIGPNFDDRDRMATQVWVCSGSCSLTCQGGVKRDLGAEAVPLILDLTPAPGGATVPTEIQVSPGGHVQTETKGRFMMDALAQAAIVAAFDASGKDLVIDYEHQSLEGGEAPAAGWITRLVAKGADGLWAVVNWTARASQYLTAREYRYLSPVLLVRKTDTRAIRIHSVALTNTPEIRKLLPLVARQHAPVNNEYEEEDRMRERLLVLLKLSADVTDEAIVAAIQALAERPAIAPELREALALSDQAGLSEAAATIHALKQGQAAAGSLQAMQAELTALKHQAAVRSRDELVATALSQGKITPAQREWAEAYALRDPEGFQVFAAKAPVVAPVGGTVTLPLSQQSGAGGIDASQRAINRALGISDEQFTKHATEGGR